MTAADAGVAIAGSLATTTNYLLGLSASAQDTVKQAIVANFMIDAQYMLPAQLGDAASAQTNLAMAQSLRSTSDSYKLMARIAESTMPKVRNAIEMVQYAIFPVFLLFVVLSGHQATGVIKSYAASLFWIQLWAPLYAVMNFIITMYSRSQYINGSAASGLSIEQMSFLNTAIVSDQAIAGMLVISIPAIAAAIVKGGEVGMQAVAGLVAPPRDPEKIASSLAMGNMQMGNASLNNVSHDTMKGLAVDMNPSLRQGATNYQARGGFDYSHFSGGGFVVKQAKSDVRADMALNDSMGAAAKENYEHSQQATQQRSSEYAESALAALKQEASFERSHARGSSDTTGYRHGMGSSRNQEANDTLRQVDQWARKMGVSEKVAMELMVEVGIGAPWKVIRLQPVVKSLLDIGTQIAPASKERVQPADPTGNKPVKPARKLITSTKDEGAAERIMGRKLALLEQVVAILRQAVMDGTLVAQQENGYCRIRAKEADPLLKTKIKESIGQISALHGVDPARFSTEDIDKRLYYRISA
jgi:hypothetical protein